MTASEFVNEKLGDKNYTHSKYPMYRSEIEEWLNEYHEQQLKILNIPVVSQRSELLAFLVWYRKQPELHSWSVDIAVQQYEKANCG